MNSNGLCVVFVLAAISLNLELVRPGSQHAARADLCNHPYNYHAFGVSRPVPLIATDIVRSRLGRRGPGLCTILLLLE